MDAMARPFMPAALCAALASAFCAMAPAATPSRYGTDLDGRALTSLASPDTRTVVLIFLASDCPISNRYIPALQHLDHQFANQHVRLWIVYPNPGETAERLRAHQTDFNQQIPELLDPDQSLVQLAGVHATPEAAVFTSDTAGLHEVYRGRIDDRYISFGQQRPQATRHELEQAISAVLTGRKVLLPGGRPVGCAIIPKP